MKILQIHNHYKVKTGGEFMVAEMDKKILENHGHSVIRYLKDNDEINDYNFFEKMLLFFKPTWSNKSYNELIKIIKNEKPDIIHAHNLTPLISPSVIYSAKKFNIPFVWTLHNYPLVCIQGMFLRKNKYCDKCIRLNTQIPAVVYGCYRNSRIATMAIFLRNKFHNFLNTWTMDNLFYIVLTNYFKDQLSLLNIPDEKIYIKGNTIFPDPGYKIKTEDFAVFVGRPVEHKGIYILLEAIKGLNLKVKIIGNSPSVTKFKEKVKNDRLNVEFMGTLSHKHTLQNLKKAKLLILPSLHIEGFPCVIVEAFACGIPVIASNHGPLSELVHHNINGLLFIVGNAKDLRKKMIYAINNERKMNELGLNARNTYLNEYHHKKNYDNLMNIYKSVLIKNEKD